MNRGANYFAPPLGLADVINLWMCETWDGAGLEIDACLTDREGDASLSILTSVQRTCDSAREGCRRVFISRAGEREPTGDVVVQPSACTEV